MKATLHGALLALACSTGLLACSSDTPPEQPGGFDRPNRVAFACVKDDDVAPLEQCEGSHEDDEDGLVLHALVTQSARGEIAAVDLEEADILDGREDIPGFTFASVGELPIAVVVPEDAPQTTYVANFGSRDITLLDTAKLLAGPGTDDARLADGTVPVELDGQRGAPVDMVLAPGGDALLVSVPELGQVLRFPIEADGHLGAAEGIDLDDSAARLVTSMPEDGAAEESYALLCGYERGPAPSPVTPEIDDSLLMARPRPGALAIDDFCPVDAGPDSCTRRLLIADETLPLIHSVDLDALASGGDALLEPIAVGVPTIDVVVTPRVPQTPTGEGETQFVYAIDATDGTVMVIEDGRVLSVSSDPSFRPDRILVGRSSRGAGSAAVLEVLTPAFDDRGDPAQFTERKDPIPEDVDPDSCLDDENEEQNPRRLRGVFLAVALTDGTVRIIDVHDNELRECRRCANRPSVDVAALDGGTVYVEPNAVWQPRVGDTVRYDDLETTVRSTVGTTGFVPAEPVFEPVFAELLDAGTQPRVDIEAPPAMPVLLRHHPRLRDNFIDDNPAERSTLTPQTELLQFVAEGGNFAVLNDGTSGSPEVPGLECMRCDRDLLQAFPDPESELVQIEEDDAGVLFARACPRATPSLTCVEPDPWASMSERWFFRYEGRIPGTSGGEGHFRAPGDPDNYTLSLVDDLGDSRVEFVAGTQFCRAGVLGQDDIAATRDGVDCDYEDYNSRVGEDDRCEVTEGGPACVVPEPHGDQLIITSRPPGRARLQELSEARGVTLMDDDLERCDDLRDALEDEDEDHVIAFAVERAYEGFLVLTPGGKLITPIGEVETWQQVELCMGGAEMGYQVRSRDGFVVTGSSSGFEHRVIAHASGRCIVDREAPAIVRGRAWKGCTFRNRTIQVRPRLERPDENALETPSGVELQMQYSTPAQKVRLNANIAGLGSLTVVPVQMKYSDVDERLYLVDIHRRGLIPISLDPFPEVAAGSFR